MKTCTVFALFLFLFFLPPGASSQWMELESGLDLARFDSGLRTENATGDLVVLRVSPEQWLLKAYLPEESDGFKGRSASRWCELGNLTAVINAGMYQSDKVTHVGYFKVDGRVINSFRNDYLSAAAFGPVDSGEPYFQIFDLDEVPLGEVAARYRTVVQNLRLIKRAGENRWQANGDRWQEAALGEDYNGNILMIFCDRRWSMHDFNEILLSLPIGLVAAQHLEGRVQASFHINHPAVEGLDIPGTSKTGPTLPNILGVTKRHPQIPLADDE